MKKERNDERPWESSYVIYVYGLLQQRTYVNCVILGKKETSILTRRLDTDILQDIQRHLAEERRFQFHHRDNLWRKWKNFLPRSGVGFITGTFFSSVQYTLNWDSLEHKESYHTSPILLL